MTAKFKPMLAVACEDLSSLRYPMLLSEKLDGIRAIVIDGVVMSRSMKPIPSRVVQLVFGREEYNGYDGEIICGDKNAKDVFNKSTRACMSRVMPDELASEDLYFYVFDMVGDSPYQERWESIESNFDNNIIRLRLDVVNSEKEVVELEEQYLRLGAEGVMLRDPNGKYKQGRSTLKEGILLKVKRFVDEEAIVIGFEEKMHNANEATTGELGQTKRSSHQENMIPCDTLGALVVSSQQWGEFKIGTGFDDETRDTIWQNKENILGKLVKFKYFPTGVKDKPRFPTFIGFRHEDDM